MIIHHIKVGANLTNIQVFDKIRLHLPKKVALSIIVKNATEVREVTIKLIRINIASGKPGGLFGNNTVDKYQ